MSKHILITGGAGFIGSHLADDLLKRGYKVRALDNLTEQVHGAEKNRPAYLDERVELQIGDVRNRNDVDKALKDIDAVYHLAARVGVGQSMYQIAEYTDENNLGTAVLLEALLERHKKQAFERLVVASSMSLYGEGSYTDTNGDTVNEAGRKKHDVTAGQWEPLGADNKPLQPQPTPETKLPDLASVYALSKYDQEKLCLITGNAYNIPTVALRFFNVYGTRQALSNPYTGALAIFSSRYMNDKAPMIFEDGLQKRDFVSVYDIAQGLRLALEVPEAAGEVFNIGSGQSFTIKHVAEKVGQVMGKGSISPEITGKFRLGDIRHCFADISKARNILGYEPKIDFEEGLKELAEWLEHQTADDKVDQASDELKRRGLTV